MGLLCLSFTHLQKSLQWACKSSFKWIKQKRFKKIEENLYIDLFWPYLDPENLAHGGHFSHMKTFWENGQKLSKFQIFTYIFVIKDPLKLEAKNKNSSSTSFNNWSNIVVHIHAKYRNDQMKTEGAYWIWKKKLMDARRLGIG